MGNLGDIKRNGHIVTLSINCPSPIPQHFPFLRSHGSSRNRTLSFASFLQVTTNSTRGQTKTQAGLICHLFFPPKLLAVEVFTKGTWQAIRDSWPWEYDVPRLIGNSPTPILAIILTVFSSHVCPSKAMVPSVQFFAMMWFEAVPSLLLVMLGAGAAT